MQQHKQPFAAHIGMLYMDLRLLHHDETADAAAGIADTSAEHVSGAFDNTAGSYDIDPTASLYQFHLPPKLDEATSFQFVTIFSIFHLP